MALSFCSMCSIRWWSPSRPCTCTCIVSARKQRQRHIPFLIYSKGSWSPQWTCLQRFDSTASAWVSYATARLVYRLTVQGSCLGSKSNNMAGRQQNFFPGNTMHPTLQATHTSYTPHWKVPRLCLGRWHADARRVTLEYNSGCARNSSPFRPPVNKIWYRLCGLARFHTPCVHVLKHSDLYSKKRSTAYTLVLVFACRPPFWHRVLFLCRRRVMPYVCTCCVLYFPIQQPPLLPTLWHHVRERQRAHKSFISKQDACNVKSSENYTCMHMTLNFKRHINFLIRHIIYWKSLSVILSFLSVI